MASWDSHCTPMASSYQSSHSSLTVNAFSTCIACSTRKSCKGCNTGAASCVDHGDRLTERCAMAKLRSIAMLMALGLTGAAWAAQTPPPPAAGDAQAAPPTGTEPESTQNPDPQSASSPHQR